MLNTDIIKDIPEPGVRYHITAGCKIMSRPTTQQKDKYNKSAYARYSFRVRKDDDLYFYLEEFMEPKETSLNYLVIKLLREHFSRQVFEAMNAPDSDN